MMLFPQIVFFFFNVYLAPKKKKKEKPNLAHNQQLFLTLVYILFINTVLGSSHNRVGRSTYSVWWVPAIGGGFFAVATSGIFLRVFLKKHKLYNLIKREIHISTITIKKHANT